MSPKPTAVYFSPAAHEDLENIWFYTFENWSAQQADFYVSAIFAHAQDLADGTRVGRSVEIREGYLKYKSGSHMLFFKRTEDGIDVIRVLHQSMDFERHL